MTHGTTPSDSQRPRRARKAVWRAVLLLPGAALLAIACLSPTQIELVIDTDVPCAEVGETRVLAGAPGSAADVGGTIACSAGRIGTIVVTPSGRGETLELRVLTAVGGGRCEGGPGQGCIEARRRIRFLPHAGVRLPVLMSKSCLGVRCEAGETCVQGTCRSAFVDATTCTREGCDEGTLPPTDGGVVDAAPDAGRCTPPFVTNPPAASFRWRFDEGPGGTTTRDEGMKLPPVSVPASWWAGGRSAACGSAIAPKSTLVLGDTGPMPAGLTIAFDQLSGLGGVEMGKATADTGFSIVGGCVELYAPGDKIETLCPYAPFTDGVWHHVAFSIAPNGTGSIVRWWVDGVVVSQAPSYVPWTPAAAPLMVSGNGTTIDDMELFDRPL